MPVFRYRYKRVLSAGTGLHTDCPYVDVRLKGLSKPHQVVANLRMRVDTGANISAVPVGIAVDVLGLPAGISASQLLFVLDQACKTQGFSPIRMGSVSGAVLRGFPLRVPIEIEDHFGEAGEFEAIIAFVEQQKPNSLLLGLTGFLDRFDLIVHPATFQLEIRMGYQIRCGI